MVEFLTNLLNQLWFAVQLVSHLLHWEGMRVFNTGLIPYFLGSPGMFGYGSTSTAFEIAQRYRVESLEGKTAIVTGASSGLGLETAKALAKNGCRVIMAVRNVSKADKLLRTDFEREAAALVTIKECDLSNLESVKKFADQMISEKSEVTLLFNNAGIGFCPPYATKDGWELQFGTNFIGHAYLTQKLLHLLDSNAKKFLKKGDNDRQKSRIVDVASIAHALIPDDMRKKTVWLDVATAHQRSNNDKKKDDKEKKKKDCSPLEYDLFHQYGYSKLANIFHTKKVAKVIEKCELEVTINAVHPGTIMNTSLPRYHTILGTKLLDFVNGIIGKSAEQGAATQMLCAVHPHFDHINGGYYQDCDVGVLSTVAKDSCLEESLFEFFNQQVLSGPVRKLE